MEILREILNVFSVNKDTFVALGALASPFVVLIGVFASLRIANKSIKGALVSSQRRDWINDVRNEVAAVLGALGPLRLKPESPQQATRAIHLLDELLVRQAKLTLLVDPKNHAQCELVGAVSDAIKHAHEAREAKDDPNYVDRLPSDTQKLIDTAHKVLGAAWKEARSLK
jgi:hypothetical protein